MHMRSRAKGVMSEGSYGSNLNAELASRGEGGAGGVIHTLE